jgi:putative FmdB family regulatory protein
MPTYEYICEKCEHEFEVFQSMKDRPLTRCPQKRCSGRVRRKLGTGAGLIFKGSGFYITDYRTDSYKKAATAEAGTSGGNGDQKKKESPAETTGGTKAEAKPKSESKPKRSTTE